MRKEIELKQLEVAFAFQVMHAVETKLIEELGLTTQGNINRYFERHGLKNNSDFISIDYLRKLLREFQRVQGKKTFGVMPETLKTVADQFKAEYNLFRQFLLDKDRVRNAEYLRNAKEYISKGGFFLKIPDWSPFEGTFIGRTKEDTGNFKVTLTLNRLISSSSLGGELAVEYPFSEEPYILAVKATSIEEKKIIQLDYKNKNEEIRQAGTILLDANARFNVLDGKFNGIYQDRLGIVSGNIMLRKY